MKKFKFISAAVVLGALTTVLSGCGTPQDVKDRANERLNTYKQPFIDRVEEAYGSGAKLKNIKCPTTARVGSPVPSVNYSVSDKLFGTIVIDGESYDAYYYPEGDYVMDNVHSKEIMNTIIDSLPIDDRKTLGTKITNQVHEYPMFPSTVTCFDEALTAKTLNGNISISVITDEDLSGYKDYDFTSIPTLNQIVNNEELSCTIRLISLEDSSMLSALLGKVHELHFSYENNHPTVYGDSASGYVDAFEYFHIKHVLNLSSEKNSNGDKYMRCVYNEKT